MSDDDLRSGLYCNIDSSRDKKMYTWEDLKRIENRRRAILKRVELPFWKILSFWDGTCLRALSTDWLLWLTVFIYCLIRVQAHFDEVFPGIVQDLGTTDIDVIGGFLSFFLVLFVNQSNSRFSDMYKESMSCAGKIFDVASLASGRFPRAHAFRIVRYMNAAHAAGYVGLSHTYSKRSFFDPLDHMCKFLTPAEMNRMNELDMDHGIDACHEIIEWCMKDVQLAAKKGFIDSRETGVLREKLMSFRSNMGSLYDFCDQPIHFFYIHFLCLLSAFYLPLFAVDNAYNAGVGGDAHWIADVMSLLIVTLQAIFVIGLRILGQKMADPYGDDLEDLSVLHYIKSAWQTSNRILAAHTFDEPSPQIEEQLYQQQEPIGAAWEPPRSPTPMNVV